MPNCDRCGNELTREERAKNPHSYVATKPDGSKNKYTKSFCDGCHSLETESKGVKEDHG